jgi:hypothetical protein
VYVLLLIVTPGEVAVAVFDPVPVAVMVQPEPPLDGVVNVALQFPPDAEKPDTVDDPEQPPLQVADVSPDGAATE